MNVFVKSFLLLASLTSMLSCQAHKSRMIRKRLIKTDTLPVTTQDVELDFFFEEDIERYLQTATSMSMSFSLFNQYSDRDKSEAINLSASEAVGKFSSSNAPLQKSTLSKETENSKLLISSDDISPKNQVNDSDPSNDIVNPGGSPEEIAIESDSNEGISMPQENSSLETRPLSTRGEDMDEYLTNNKEGAVAGISSSPSTVPIIIGAGAVVAAATLLALKSKAFFSSTNSLASIDQRVRLPSLS